MGMLQELSKKYLGMKSEEDLKDSLKQFLGQFKGTLLADKFAEEIFEDEVLSIHQKKAKCKWAYNNFSFIRSAVDNAVNAIIGNKSKIISKSDHLENYVNSYWLKDSGLRKAERQAINNAVNSGDGFIEVIETNLGYKYANIEEAECMYIDYDYMNMKPIRYLLEVSEGGKDYTINTPDGNKTIHAIEYAPEQIIHYQFGSSKRGIYGNSPLFSILTDIKILKIIERSIAVIARYKAVPRKILMPDASGEEGTLSQQEVDIIKQQFEESKDLKTPLIGKKLSAIDTSFGGKDINLTQYMDYFKRKITIVLTPEFIMFGENANRATSREQKQIYYLAISAIREYFVYTTQDAIFKGLCKIVNNLKDKGIETLKFNSFEYQYGEYAVELTEDKYLRWLAEWEKGLITMKKYYELMGYEDEGLDVYYWEVMQQQINSEPSQDES